MGRDQKNIYCFISDDSKKFYRATQQVSGDYAISFNSNPYPIGINPTNLLENEIEFATNGKYMSMVRSIINPLNFVKDGAAILRHLYFLRKGVIQNAYLTIIEWDGDQGIYVLSYYGKFDFSQKREDPKSGSFTVPTIDDSAWGVLSLNDDTQYAIECNQYNPKAIKVLVDGTTLKNKYTYQTVQAPIIDAGPENWLLIPFVLINQDGDSYGIISKSQSFQGNFTTLAELQASAGWFISTIKAINGVIISGSIHFVVNTTQQFPYLGIRLYFRTSLGQNLSIVLIPQGPGVYAGQVIKKDFSFTVNLASGENVFLVLEMGGGVGISMSITPVVTNVSITTETISDSVIVYGLRAIDLLQQVVAKATENRFTINSEHFTTFNKDVCTSGEAIRGIPNAKIYTSFSDFFKSFDSIYFLAMRVINGELWMEKATTVYNKTGTLLDIGEIIDMSLSPALDYFCNEIEVGSPKQDLRHPSGKLEFNSTNTFSLPVKNINKKISLISIYRLGCYEIIFLILDYRGGSTQDNNGDKSVFVIKITDEIGYARDDIETFENIDFNNASLNPIIKSPLTNSLVTYNKPTIKGIASASTTVNIYVDGVLDGSTVSDGNGNWTYEINTALVTYDPGVETGIHLIEATYTDLLAPYDSISITVDTAQTTVEDIIYPDLNDSLYNNKPLIKGVAPAGTNIDISLDGVLIGSVVTDNSNIWTFKVVVPFTNGNHTLSINGGVSSNNFDVDTNVDYPLITYVGSELDGFVVFNNLPLIEGVAIPGTLVDIWLNYIPYAKLGTAVADANGNWSFQVIPVNYIDPGSGLPVILAPIRNGISVISTSLANHVVGVVVTGYKLSRPNYSVITGVIDNTVFNTEYSPKRMFEQRNPLWAAILKQQPQSFINFQTAGQNSQLATVLNGVSVIESLDVQSSSLGTPIALLENADLRVKARTSFAKTLYDFSNGGVVTCSFRGNQLYFLPIGGMKIPHIKSDVQEWRLLFSPDTTLQTLLNLYKQGTTISLMQNSIYHSDYNSLHFVAYNHTLNPKYQSKEIYDDWFENRNEFWALNPGYIQKFQTNDAPVRDQIIANGVSSISLKIYSCIDGSLVDTISYNAIASPPIPPPDIILEAIIDWSLYPVGQYFTVMYVDVTPIMISERIETRVKWDKTILIEANNSINMVGAYFSTGFKSFIRVEGIVKKWAPDITSITATEESGNNEMLYSQNSRKRRVQFGTAYGLPDYLYLRIANALALDELLIEGVRYVVSQEDKIELSEEVPGHPLFYYEVVLSQYINTKGLTSAGAPGGIVDGVILVVDGLAMGLPAGSLININVE